MPQTVTFSIKTGFGEGSGPKIPEVIRDNKISASLSVIEDVLNDKNWTDFDVLGGDRQQIEFLLIAADRYKDQNCPRDDDPGLLFKFEDGDNSYSLHLDGPQLYVGHTASCLPPKVDKIYFQNRMAEKVKIYILLGRKPKKKDKNGLSARMNGVSDAATATPATTPVSPR